MHAGRRKGKTRSRILYWFRTPPGVKVGRAALDEEAIRLIEEHNPEVEFDWTRILKGQASDTTPAPPVGRERFQQGRRRSDPGPSAPVHPPGPPVKTPAATVAPVPGVNVETSGKLNVVELLVDEVRRAAEDLVGIDGGSLGTRRESIDGATVEDAPLTPAHARLGSEGVLRLRARHAELLARISERIQDAARQDELKGQAERLNPDTWVTDSEVIAGLEEYETVFEALRTAVGGPGRGRRNKGQREGGQPELPGRRLEHSNTENS